MRISVIAIGIALLLPACVTESESGKAASIDWEPPVWSNETAEISEQPAPDTSIPEWSSNTTQAEPSDQEMAQDNPPRWVSLASLLEGRIEHNLGETVRQHIDAAFNRVLGKNQAGAGMPWSEDGTNSRGRLVVTRLYDAEGGIQCGVVDHRHRIGEIDVGGSLMVCRAQSGHWVVRKVRWWSADETQAKSLDGDDPSSSWQTLNVGLTAPESGVEGSTEGGNWSIILNN